MTTYSIPSLPLVYDLETKEILKQCSKAHRYLAELKGVAKTIPNERILLSVLGLQEAKDSSAVENIVTTHDELYKEDTSNNAFMSLTAKEVYKYSDALSAGFRLVQDSKLLTNNTIKHIHKILEENDAGFRVQSGTTLKDSLGKVVYTPPQDPNVILASMTKLEAFINTPELSDLDPLIKMAVIHHQFESIHPFYDGNGRTGRIISILYLVLNDLLELPILYLSRYIIENKLEYYQLLQKVRTEGAWHEWVLFMLKGVEEIAQNSIHCINGIHQLMQEYKHTLRPLFEKKYTYALLNNLFFHVYTKNEFLQKDLGITRQTAAQYLDAIAEKTNLLDKQKIGKTNYYINTKLFDLLVKN